MALNELISEIFNHVQNNNAFGAGCATGVDSLFAMSNPNPTAYEATLYEPVMCPRQLRAFALIITCTFQLQIWRPLPA